MFAQRRHCVSGQVKRGLECSHLFQIKKYSLLKFQQMEFSINCYYFFNLSILLFSIISNSSFSLSLSVILKQVT